MLENIKQAEMDEMERYVLSKLENMSWFKSGTRWGVINVQQHIDNFEKNIFPLLNEDGTVKFEQAKVLYVDKFPILQYINLPNMRLIDIAKKII